MSAPSTPTALRFGVIGSFAGDAARVAAALRLHDRLQQGAFSAAVTTAQVREVLSSLPMRGRVEFCATSLLSPDMPAAVREQNGTLVMQLFCECFDAVGPAATPSAAGQSASRAEAAIPSDAVEHPPSRPDVDEWVIVSLCAGPSASSSVGELSSSLRDEPGASRPDALLYLNSSAYYVLRALLAGLHGFGSVGVALFDKYISHTTSTVLRSAFIKAMVALPAQLFSDERLEAVYHSSVEAVRRIIESECKKLNGQRACFLSSLIAQGATSAANGLIHYAAPAQLEEHFLRSVQTMAAPTLSGQVLSVVNHDWLFKANWALHADAYLCFLNNRLEAHRSDPLWCGCFLSDFYSLLFKGGLSFAMSSAVAMQLFNIHGTYRPLAIDATVPLPVKHFLFELSKQGALCDPDGSASTKDIAYAGVSRLLPPPLVLRAMSGQDKWKALTGMIIRTEHGMAFAPPVQQLCEILLKDLVKRSGFHHDISELAQQVTAALSPRDFHCMVHAAETIRSQIARTSRIVVEAALAIKGIRFSQPVLQAWLELHLDNTPDKLQQFAPGQSVEQLWAVWYDSICGVLRARLVVIASKALLAVQATSVRATRSPITSYVGYAALLSECLLLVLQRCAHILPPQQPLQTAIGVLDVLGPIVDRQSLTPLYPPASEQQEQLLAGARCIAAVRSAGERLSLLAVSLLQRSLNFDVGSSRYAQVSAAFLRTQLNQLTTTSRLKLFPALGPALFAFYTDLLRTSELPAEVQQRGFIMVPPKQSDELPLSPTSAQNRQVTWVFVNSSHHLQCAALATEKLEQLCGQARVIPALEQIALEAWKLVRPTYFPTLPSAAESLHDVSLFDSFLAACAKLPSSVAEPEKALLLPALVHHLQANTLRSATIGVGLAGCWTFLLSALDACGAEWPGRNSWLLQFEDISLAPVRDCLQQATHDREPQTRQQAFLHLLAVSIGTSWREFARSIKYVQSRIRNEAGLYRRDIYHLIASNFPTAVLQSLHAAGTFSAGTEEEALAGVRVITDSLDVLLRDDLSKRDSVAKGIFRSLGATLIKAAISHVAPPHLAIRYAWIACGQALDLLLLRAGSGEDAGRDYVWPLASTVFSCEHRIAEDALAGAVRAAVLAGLRDGERVYTSLSQRAYRSKQHIHVAPEKLYVPEQAVELLCSTRTAQAGESPVWAADYLVDGAFFPAGDATTDANPNAAAACESSTLRCMQQLFRFCGTRWTSVPRLVRFFERVVSTVADPARHAQPLFASHYRQTCTLFHSVHQQYAQGTAWFELEPLSRACSVLFTLAVQRGEASDAQMLRPLWTVMRMYKGKIHTCDALSLSDLSFLITNVGHMRSSHATPVLPGRKKDEGHLADTADTYERAATRLRDLLTLSPSSLHLVWSELIGLRDDIFGLYLGRTQGELSGVFSTGLLSPPHKAAAEEAYFPVTSAQLKSLNAHAMRAVTRMYNKRAMDRSLSAGERSHAVTQFVQSPAASHHDVVALLVKLHSVIASRSHKEMETKKTTSIVAATETDSASEAVVDDDSADLLLESVILRVFDTDATWFVLAFLLDPKTIASAPQRTTAAIVTNLRLWAPVDRTVAVLRVLLEPSRRWVIGHFLHKQILRLLFECSDQHALARELFTAEWNQRAIDLPKDVCYEAVKLAASALNDRNEEKQALAWSIAEDLVADASQNSDTATLLLLFAPTWQPDAASIELSTLLRATSPPRRQTIGGVEAPDSFSHVHSLLLAVDPASVFSTSTRQMRQRMVSLMRRLSVTSQNQHVRVLSQLQQFVFSSLMAGEADDEAMEQLRELLLGSTVNARVATDASMLSRSVLLDQASEWALDVIARLYAGLSTQVLARALTTSAASTSADADLCSALCQTHPYAVRLKDTVGTLLHSLLNTPPAQAERRFRVATALRVIAAQVSHTPSPKLPTKATKPSTWLVELIQSPFGDLVNFLRRDSEQSAQLVHSAGM